MQFLSAGTVKEGRVEHGRILKAAAAGLTGPASH
jgi:hypothetical protein